MNVWHHVRSNQKPVVLNWQFWMVTVLIFKYFVRIVIRLKCLNVEKTHESWHKGKSAIHVGWLFTVDLMFKGFEFKDVQEVNIIIVVISVVLH